MSKPKQSPRKTRPACAAKGCESKRMTISKYCLYHRNKVRKWGSPTGKPLKRCAAWGCKEIVKAKGYCLDHYLIIRTHGHIPAGYKPKLKAKCSIDNCDSTAQSKSLCAYHYQRHRNKHPELVEAQREKISKRNANIVALRKQGNTYETIAKRTDTTIRIVGIVCRKESRLSNTNRTNICV